MSPPFSADVLFNQDRKSIIRILIVADGAIHFVANDNQGFCLSELIQQALLPGALPWETIKITTARRGKDGDKCADISDFKFDAGLPKHLSFNIQNYDQLWLFGQEPQASPSCLTPDEINAIFEFMNQGGGVFATGDHEDVGYALCGQIPRVRRMRKWHYHCVPHGEVKAPGRNDETRIDTLRPGNAGFQFTDQSDRIPQEIRPKFYLDADGKGSVPHPLLAYRSSVVSVLPDHMHEGECVIPSELNCPLPPLFDRTFDEFPCVPDSDYRLAPDLVAISTSAGGHILSEASEHLPPVEPRSFNIIVAYDGHVIDRVENGEQQTLGRVSVDSSFHHFLDINLIGLQKKDDKKKRGFYDENGNPTESYLAFTQYYRNIARWLSPPDLQAVNYHLLLVHLRFSAPALTGYASNAQPTLSDFENAGRLVFEAIVQHYSKAEAVSCILALLRANSTKTARILEILFDPWRPLNLRLVKFRSLYNNQLFTRALLGSAVIDDSMLFVKVLLGSILHQVIKQLPADPGEAARQLSLDVIKGKALVPSVNDGVEMGLTIIDDVLAETRSSLGCVLKLLTVSGVTH